MIRPEDVTIIIPHFGGEQQQCYALKECVASLVETAPDIERIIVKNGPSCLCDRDMRIIKQGQCKAVNAAVAIVDTPWVLVTNDDMVYPPGWFESLCRLGAGPYVDLDLTYEKCISPKLIEPRDGAPTFEKYFCGGVGGDFDKQKFLEFAKVYANRPQADRTLRTGFNLPFLIDTELFGLIGGYDVKYDPWSSNSDSDLEYKIRLAGVQPMQNQNAIVYHFSQTSGTFNPTNSNYWHKNFQYFKEKWGFDRTDEGIWEANFKIPEPPERKFTPWWENFYNK